MKRQSLDGVWSYRIGKGGWSEREVPYSSLAVGHSECRRSFSLSERASRVFLRFDGITYAAEVYLNGTHLGHLLAYAEYTFDVTALVREEENELLVLLEDLSAEFTMFGPAEGWENFGGVIRSVSLLYAEESYLEDCFFYTELTDGYRAASYTLELKIAAPEGCRAVVSLTRGGETADAFACAAEASVKLCRRVEGVKLWSPDSPALYELEVQLEKDGRLLDTYACSVGFREFKCDQSYFYLNGERTFLLGVCRHEMIGDKGHTVTPEEIERDLLAIKRGGCNFVRLVHYPHRKETLEIADRLGLMVSEEPGLWWSDTANKEIAEGSLEVLRRTVLRDRNHPSVVFWLSFNECRFTEAYLVDAVKTCRAADPTRLVSGANCMSNEDTLKYFNLCDFDFYTMHPYAPDFDRARKAAAILHDKPLVFTEWGGFDVQDNPRLLRNFIGEMGEMYREGELGHRLAGAFFWCWAEVHDFNRGAPACEFGVLREGLVTMDRQPTMIHDPFFAAWREALLPKKTAAKTYGFCAAKTLRGTPMRPIDPDDAELNRILGVLKSGALDRGRMRRRRPQVGPVLARSEWEGVPARPMALPDKGKLSFVAEGSMHSRSLSLLGGVGGLHRGYPLGGTYGETVATVTVETEAGECFCYPLCNGVEITTVHTTLAGSRILPVAERATELARFHYDENHENYLINRIRLPLPSRCVVTRVTIRSEAEGYALLFWGVLCEEE